MKQPVKRIEYSCPDCHTPFRDREYGEKYTCLCAVWKFTRKGWICIEEFEDEDWNTFTKIKLEERT